MEKERFIRGLREVLLSLPNEDLKAVLKNDILERISTN